MSEPEFSRIVRLDAIPPDGLTQDLAASEEECARLAARFGFLSIASLTGLARLRPTGEGAVLEAELTAEIEQACVVTLDPVKSRLRHDFALEYRTAPPGMTAETVDAPDETDSDEAPGTQDEADWEWIFDGKIDIGEAFAEELALAADPYPRAADASLEEILEGQDTAAPEHPFAALAKLKSERED